MSACWVRQRRIILKISRHSASFWDSEWRTCTSTTTCTHTTLQLEALGQHKPLPVIVLPPGEPGRSDRNELNWNMQMQFFCKVYKASSDHFSLFRSLFRHLPWKADKIVKKWRLVKIDEGEQTVKFRYTNLIIPAPTSHSEIPAPISHTNTAVHDLQPMDRIQPATFTRRHQARNYTPCKLGNLAV